MSLLRALRHVVFDASRSGRAAEVAAWSNGFASLGIGGASGVAMRSWPIGIGAFFLSLGLLRAALAHRHTVWISATFGSLAVSAMSGALAWLFGHVVDVPWFPHSVAVVVALGTSAVPAWAYANLAARRAVVPDSLVHPVVDGSGAPSSR